MSTTNSASGEDQTLATYIADPTSDDYFEKEVMPLLDEVVRTACHHCHHSASAKEVERLSQRLCLHLLEKPERLKSFQQCSLLRTWLQKVANNYVSRFLQRESKYIELEAVPSVRSTLLPMQESEILEKEQLVALVKALKKLTPRERKLVGLIMQNLSAKEIAQRMGRMKEASVYPRKNAVTAKLRMLMGLDKRK